MITASEAYELQQITELGDGLRGLLMRLESMIQEASINGKTSLEITMEGPVGAEFEAARRILERNGFTVRPVRPGKGRRRFVVAW